ncbi:hypothetical protein L195_g006206 [Trifolium pratense]|uniref:Retrotransposon Copia-like N-terminal domain-containing protein n=1 Tax=Trifolium pratense TaxID=57577 RepID=A0A2K3P2Y4_TRIPR|nr:hypothetical protein L195_g006206 [Trifolium pratense]
MPPRVSPVIPPATNTDSVFYVHPREGPNSVVVTPCLNGSNYLAWSISMRRALGARNKLLSLMDQCLFQSLQEHPNVNKDQYDHGSKDLSVIHSGHSPHEPSSSKITGFADNFVNKNIFAMRFLLIATHFLFIITIVLITISPYPHPTHHHHHHHAAIIICISWILAICTVIVFACRCRSR